MRGSLIAFLILVLILAGVVWNAVCIRRVTDNLLTELNALPTEPDPAATPAAVAEVRMEWEGHLKFLGVTVPHAELDRVTEAFRILEARAEAGDGAGYAATLALLRELAGRLAEAEKVSLNNIL